jgi:hypothetical protein
MIYTENVIMILREVWFVMGQDEWKSIFKKKRVKVLVLKPGHIQTDTM